MSVIQNAASIWSTVLCRKLNNKTIFCEHIAAVSCSVGVPRLGGLKWGFGNGLAGLCMGGVWVPGGCVVVVMCVGGGKNECVYYLDW